MGIKVALIPPMGWERYLRDSDEVQMALAIEPCMSSPSYVNAMRDASIRRDEFVILDNGEAEGERTRGAKTVEFAKTIGAKELVLPDVMGNRHDTIEKVAAFFTSPSNFQEYMSYMAVAQGKSVKELQLAIHYYANMTAAGIGFPNMYPITTIGIPRNLIRMTATRSARIDLANWIAEEFPNRFQVHFLGAVASWPQEVRYASQYAPIVRSIDTSLPFNFAVQGKLIELQTNGSNVDRHPDFMTGRLLRDPYSRHVMRNIEVYKKWAATSPRLV